MSQWTNPHTGKSYGEVYSSEELTVIYFERHGSPDCVEGDFVQVTGPGHRAWRMWTENGKVFSRAEWERMLEAATGSPQWLDEALNSGDGSYRP